ncbi:MAG: glycerophosphodiester phosphodiesterase family protein [Jatrophihabitans sp.]
MTRFLAAACPIAFTHRGFGAPGSENSLAAFQRAVDLGFRYLETDARVTADGVAVAFHDGSLDRTTDRQGRLIDQPWSRVRKARIGGTEPIPRLAELLDAWPDCFVNIDVKSDAAVAATLDAVRSTRAHERICIAAFSDRRLGLLRTVLGPGVCSALGPSEALRLRALPFVGGQRPLVTNRVAQLPFRIGRLPVVDARLLLRAHRRGLAVHAWTVNEAAEMHRLLDLGVDGIMTDRADLLRDVLRERGAWPAR